MRKKGGDRKVRGGGGEERGEEGRGNVRIATNTVHTHLLNSVTLLSSKCVYCYMSVMEELQ